MSGFHRIDRDKNILYVSYQGAVSQDELLSCVKEALDDPLYDDKMNRLVDLRKAKTDLKFNVDRLTEALFGFILARTKMAIVTNDSLTVAKAMLFLETRKGHNRLFTGYENAEAWLIG